MNNHAKILQLTKMQMYDLLKRVIIHTNRWAFLLENRLEEIDKHEKLKDLKFGIYKEFGIREADGLKKIGIIEGSGITAVVLALQYSHWAILENVIIDVLDNKTINFGVTNCTTVKAMKKLGKPLDCSSTGYIIREAFVKVFCPTAKVTRKYTSSNNNDLSCLWEITVD